MQGVVHKRAYGRTFYALLNVDLGSIYTQTKSHDNEIQRVLENHLKIVYYGK